MKSLSSMTCLALILCSACTKIIDKPIASQSFAAKTASVNSTVENLGTAITGANILWKINPLHENIEPLFTPLPFSNSGVSLLMIDNGNRGYSPFRFIAVNLQNNTSKTISIVDKNGAIIPHSVGRITRYMFGMNKKFYVATENGGHLIEYDPYTQIAKDLGQPFKVNGRTLDIYSLNVGKDGALYGGSFGGGGDVYTFRYDYTNFYVDKTSIDAEARYVTYVTGDEKYTYASCGQNAWKMYSIDRTTGKKTVLLNSANPSERIYSTSNTDACYAQFNGLNYRLSGNTATAVSPYDKAAGPQMSYVPYEANNPMLPKVNWSEVDRKLYYKFAGAEEKFVKVDNVIEEVYSTSAIAAIDNKLFITGGTIGRCVTYTPGQGYSALGGTSINVYAMAAMPNSGGKKILMGGYPKGVLLQYETSQTWNLGTQTISNTAPDIYSQASNPRKITQLQDADNTGVFGPMSIGGMFYTKDGTLVAAGNNDRLTESASRELGIGTFKNGIKRNFSSADMRNYEFTSMCLSKDSSEVYISAISKHGAEGKIFRYNPTSNTIVSEIKFPLDKNPGMIKLLKDNLLVGTYEDVVYVLDVNTKAIVWKTVLGNGQRINAFTVAPDGGVYVNYNYLNAFTSKLVRFDINTKNTSSVTTTVTEVSIIKNPDSEESTRPSGLIFMKSNRANTYDLYIAGFMSLCRISNVIAAS